VVQIKHDRLINAASHNECDCSGRTPWTRRSVLKFGATAFALGCPLPVVANEHGGLLEPSLKLSLASEQDRVVALTLDACSGGCDFKILDALIASSVPATLFLTARWIKSNPEGLRLILDHPNLFAIGNHGAQHIAAVLGTSSVFGVRTAGDLDTIKAEIIDGAEAIHHAAGVEAKWYRGATALYSPQAVPLIQSLGFSIAGFSLNADEGASLPASSVSERMKRARHGDVIIAHMNQPHRPSGAGVITGVRALLDQGVKFAKLENTTPVLASLDRRYL